MNQELGTQAEALDEHELREQRRNGRTHEAHAGQLLRVGRIKLKRVADDEGNRLDGDSTCRSLHDREDDKGQHARIAPREWLHLLTLVRRRALGQQKPDGHS